MKKYLILALASILMACSKDEEPYPSVISEFVDIKSDSQGCLVSILTDTDQNYTIASPITGYRPNAKYRGACGYVPVGQVAHVRSLQPVQYLRDSSKVVRHDPIAVYSVWGTRRYVNMQLRPMTQGGQQYWGFAVDSILGRTAYLSLHHNQGNDLQAYSTDVYASLSLDSIKQDSIQFTIHTFKGLKTWTITK